MTQAHLFEHHDEAYHSWSPAGIRGASIVPVDAHHDLAWLDDPIHLDIANSLGQAINRRWREAISETGRAFALLCSALYHPRRSS